MNEELEGSLKAVGQIEDIIRCKQHDQMILSGRHRNSILHTQGRIARARLFDCDDLARRENISHDLAHWIVIRASNMRRLIDEEEQKADLMQMAVILDRDGVPAGKRVGIISRLTGLGPRRVEQLLPKEHKGPTGPKDETETISVSEKGRFSEDASKHSIKSYTEAEQLFAGNLSYFNVEYRTQETFIRPGEFTNGNQQKTFIADFYLPKRKVVIELEGSGSASSDNKHRDQYFKEQGIKVAHLPNAVATKYGAQIAELIACLL